MGNSRASSSSTNFLSSMSSAQGGLQQRRRRGQRRRPTAVESTETGPVRPVKTKKPPPQPSGQLCVYGLCCHFGTACVNQHTVDDISFFKKREELRLQLREMALQVEQKKVEYKREKMATRQPLHTVTNTRQVPSNRGAAQASSSSNKSAAKPPTKEQSSTEKPAQAPATIAPAQPPHAPIAMVTVTPVSVTPQHPHYQCMSHGTKCSAQCAVKTAVDDDRWEGTWLATQSVWGRSEPPSWDQQPDPNPEHRYILDANKQHTVNINYGVSWGKNNQWVHDTDTDLWFPIRKQNGEILMRPFPHK